VKEKLQLNYDAFGVKKWPFPTLQAPPCESKILLPNLT